MNEVSDYLLIDRVVARNDQHAFAELVKRYQSQIRYSLRQLNGWDEAGADDLAQETFLKVYKAIGSFRKDSKFSTWLYRIATNTFIASTRKGKLDTESLDSDSSQEASKHLIESPDSESEDADLQRDLAVAMTALSPEQRSILHLFLHKQCTHQEISDIMGLPLGTVKTHINRGRTSLQERLQHWKQQ